MQELLPLLDLKQIKSMTRLSYSTIRKKILEGTFPKSQNGKGKKLLWTQESLRIWQNQATCSTMLSDVGISQSKREAKACEQSFTDAKKILEKHATARRTAGRKSKIKEHK
jgi:predicted DNA-binding transcriptional regulator AlpA